MMLHLLCLLECLFQLSLVFLKLLLQLSDLGLKLGLFLSARLLQSLKCLDFLVQLTPLFVQIGASPLQVVMATPKLLGTGNQRWIMCVNE